MSFTSLIDHPSCLALRAGVVTRFLNFGTVAAASPMRQFEDSFRENGVPVFVHALEGGPIVGDRLEDSIADITDLEFLKAFQKGLTHSARFRELIVPSGANYGSQTAVEIVGKLSALDLGALPDGGPLAALRDTTARPFDPSTPIGAAKMLIINSAIVSAKLNFAFDISLKHGFIPLADAQPFCDLLHSRYLRAVKNVAGVYPATVADLSFNIFDRILPHGIERLTVPDAVALGAWDIVGIGPTDVVLVQVKTNDWPGSVEMETLRGFRVPSNCKKLVRRWRDRQRVPDVREL